MTVLFDCYYMVIIVIVIIIILSAYKQIASHRALTEPNRQLMPIYFDCFCFLSLRNCNHNAQLAYSIDVPTAYLLITALVAPGVCEIAQR